MSRITRVVRYRTKPECADENERLIRAAMDELAASKPENLRYAVLRLEDGVTFVHFAEVDIDNNPLAISSAFTEFQSDITDRFAEAPDVVSEATVIANYQMLAY
jgi:hypothetical protein